MNWIEMKSVVGMNSASRMAASYVFCPAAALKSASLFTPLVFEEVFERQLELPHPLVKLDSLPVESITPVSPGVTSPETLSPSLQMPEDRLSPE